MDTLTQKKSPTWIDQFNTIKAKVFFLAFLTLVAYMPAIRAGFIWDDDVITAPHGIVASGLWKIWTHPVGHYWPMFFTTFWLEHHLWGNAAMGYHLTNVLLHIIDSILLYTILRRLSVPGAWLSAAIFSLHPTHVESVAWITERKDVLSGIFYMATFLAYWEYEENKDRKKYIAALILFICAILTKAMVVSLPLIILLCLWWKNKLGKIRDIYPLIPFFILPMLIVTIDVKLEQHAFPGSTGLSFLQRCLLAGRALWFYAGKLVCPLNLMTVYPQWHIDSHRVWQYIYPCLFAAILIVLWLPRKQIGKGPLVGVLYFAITLGPVLGFLDFSFMGNSFVADRYEYLPSIGLIALFSAGIYMMLDSLLLPSILKPTICILLPLFLGILTWKQAGLYKNMETLFRDNVEKNPRAWVAQYNLATELEKDGKIQEAIDHYAQSLAVNPIDTQAHNNIANLYVKQGKFDEAFAHYSKALELKPNFAIAHENLADLLRQEGKLDDAIKQYSKAIELQPDFGEAHNNLATVYIKKGMLLDAVSQLTTALTINPDNDAARHNLQYVINLENQKKQK